MEEHSVPCDVLQKLLNSQDNKNNPVKNVFTTKFSTLAKGENYLADVARVKVTVLREDGTTEFRSFFLKRLPVTQKKRKFVLHHGFFSREIKIYNDVLPLMSELLLSVGDNSKKSWTEFFWNQGSELIIMEDLVKKGYSTNDRRKLLDFEYSSLVLKSLGKFHALSATLKERSLVDMSDFKYMIFTSCNESEEKFVSFGMKNIVNRMEEWGPEWSNLKTRLLPIVKDIPGVLKKICALNTEGLNVLNHGDLWSTNIFFRQNKHSGQLCDLKFIDFQCSYYNSYAFDIQYFLNTSVKANVRKYQYNDLLKVYHNSLEEWLTKFNHKQIPTLEDVKSEVRGKLLFGVILSVSFLHFMQAKSGDAVDLEGEIDNYEDTSTHIVQTEDYQTKAKAILEQLFDVDINSLF